MLRLQAKYREFPDSPMVLRVKGENGSRSVTKTPRWLEKNAHMAIIEYKAEYLFDFNSPDECQAAVDKICQKYGKEKRKAIILKTFQYEQQEDTFEADKAQSREVSVAKQIKKIEKEKSKNE